MSVKEKQFKKLAKDSKSMEQEKNLNQFQLPHSLNETPVDLLDPVLIRWIKVIKPSRASLTYERFE